MRVRSKWVNESCRLFPARDRARDPDLFLEADPGSKDHEHDQHQEDEKRRAGRAKPSGSTFPRKGVNIGSSPNEAVP
jgi:hypothetical protein